MDIISTLQKFDLSKNESRVYVALLKLGSTTVGPLVKKTKLHRQAIYEALDKLEQLKLISHVVKNNRKNFQASSPAIITDEITKKQKLGQQLVAELLKIQSKGDDDINVKIMYGRNGHYDNLIDFVNSAAKHDKVMRIIGGASDTIIYNLLGNLYKNYVTECQKVKVKKYLIAASKYSDEFKQKFAQEKGNVLKLMDTGLISPTFTRMTPEMISVEVFADDVMIVQIKNESIAQAYLDHFEILWKQAELYKG